MATTYKTFLNNDITSTKTLLHESIPLTGALVSGTYGTYPSGSNIKNYAHGMFQSVYPLIIFLILRVDMLRVRLCLLQPMNKMPRKLIFTIKWLKSLWGIMRLVLF